MSINFDHQRDRIGTSSGVIKFNMPGALVLPIGDTNDRPIAETGQIRFNSENSVFEGYDGVAWSTIGTGVSNNIISDSNNDTYVITETGSANNDQIDFFTAGVHRLQIDDDGTLKFGENLNKFTVDYTTGDMFLEGDLNHNGTIDGGNF